MAKAIFVRERIEVEAPGGATVLDAARLGGVYLESPCNGNGTCGKCLVAVGGRRVLACRTALAGGGGDGEGSGNGNGGGYDGGSDGGNGGCGNNDCGGGGNEASNDGGNSGDGGDGSGNGDGRGMEITTLGGQSENSTLQILAGGRSRKHPLKPRYPKGYGLVADIGTTTLVATLANLETGAEAGTESMLNPQAQYAQDVLSRIHFAGEPGGLDTLHGALTDALNGAIGRLAANAGIAPRDIRDAVYSGNTTMLSIASRVDPSSLGRHPYSVALRGGAYIPAGRLGIGGEIYIPPIISAFVGADITSGILASGLADRREPTLFIDIGTNGEMVLAVGGRLIATSTAAGPAFEGMNISQGKRASRGAIESFRFCDGDCDGDGSDGGNGGGNGSGNGNNGGGKGGSAGDGGSFAFSTIGGAEADGICGSGLLDIVAELARTGRVEKTGRLASRAVAFQITDRVALAQKDIRQVQLAKGAVRTGIDAMLRKLGLAPGDIERVEIAGSFGYHLNERSLLNLKLLPPEFEGKTRFVGNTSISGGAAFLLNTGLRDEMAAVAKTVEKIELANDEDFQKRFVASLGF
ncbi:MAG: ASKHA domain-containing protein [Clostridiales bacterium]|nr:ASKHA domain-containing protein [Clostridiales bacterium]